MAKILDWVKRQFTREARVAAYVRGSKICPACGAPNCAKLAKAIDERNRKQAQQIREQIFRDADAFEIDERTFEVRPIFLTPAQKEKRLDAQLRERADAALRRIRVDAAIEEFNSTQGE